MISLAGTLFLSLLLVTLRLVYWKCVDFFTFKVISNKKKKTTVKRVQGLNVYLKTKANIYFEKC